jgi:hypothetical protein
MGHAAFDAKAVFDEEREGFHVGLRRAQAKCGGALLSRCVLHGMQQAPSNAAAALACFHRDCLKRRVAAAEFEDAEADRLLSAKRHQRQRAGGRHGLECVFTRARVEIAEGAVRQGRQEGAVGRQRAPNANRRVESN